MKLNRVWLAQMLQSETLGFTELDVNRTVSQRYVGILRETNGAACATLQQDASRFGYSIL
jgi:hypothetical protein